jgi:YD repeat-containing protein
VVVPAEDVNAERAQATAKSALHIVNELSNRRRLTTFFANEQSPFHGVQVNYVNVGRGNLTFLNRDLVRLDRIPIVAGRVYDSRLEAENDFGPDWKLSVSEVIRHRGNTLRYIDASGSVYELELEGTRIVSRYPHLTGISGGRRQSGDIELRTANFTKRFTNIGGDFYLSRITDGFGNSLRLQYTGKRINRISSENGRYVEVVRDASGRIVSMRDDAGRTVDYQYDSAGRLSSVRGMGAGQWRYRYDANGHLHGATDPRDIDALTANYAQEGRVSDVRILYDVMSFSYQGSTTAVRNGLQQAATFWHDQSGLTKTIQDFEGSTTQIAFDSALRPASLSFNGTLVAELLYGQNDKLQTVRSSVERRPRVSRFSYDGVDRLRTVIADNRPIARYTYDAAGRVLRAEDTAGSRSYEYFGATGYEIRFGETELDVETNRLGLMRGFSNGHQSVDISYNEFDRVSELGYAEYGKVFQAAYQYGTSGLRSTGSYTKSGEATRATLSLDYDVVGNLTDLGVEAPSGARSSQTYVLGMNNQLTRLMNPHRADLVFEYDAVGRPTRRTLGTNDVSHTYDSLGRVTAVYERDRKMLEWRYGPMDVDAATEADDHTPWTAINEPIASAIFGSAESIAYARTRGTPFGPIRFSAPMARFVLATQLIPSADGVTLVSLQRRNVPLSADHHAGVSPAPLEFDKPSNALFLPAEFSSLNCYLCVGRFEGGTDMTVNGSTGTPTVLAGHSATISVISGATQCLGDVWLDYQYAYSEAGETAHYFDFDGDGNWVYAGTNGSVVSKTVSHTYNTPGSYTVRGEVTCGCYWGGMFWDVQNPARSINVVCPVPINFNQVADSDNNGVLHLEYAWQSSTGNLADLDNCTVGEIVTYPSGNPYAPGSPFTATAPNPTVIDAPATTGAGVDNHSMFGVSSPYSAASFTATQYYRYRCTCANGGNYVNMVGPLSIVRQVSQNPNGSWKYNITKPFGSATKNPLP